MKPALTRADLVRAGLEVLDAHGIEGLTVRAVAARLGVQAPALYWHVRNKQDLRDEMATEIWRRISATLQVLPPDIGWTQEMTAFATTTRAELLSHRDGAKVFSGTYLNDTGVLHRQEAGLARMMAEGFTLADALRVWSLVYSFTIGFCIEEQSVRQAVAAGDPRYSLEAREERLSDGEHPLVVAAGPELFGDPDARFADLVAVLVETAERLRAHT
ncbi:TetR/AcrR family transcriptional regulator C-terminal domain-containing protein [uncultured Friedmanniella sp.]|uniref:TetR/AcrR family transcriptional regulator C-terminal domain-containing protein n=1 Tax=uncultured Friedmanniella sp. TaxID=335381 RepID=UPI0035CC0168